MRGEAERLTAIAPWTYWFDWSYSFEEIIEVFLQWPVQQYTRITILEWWSSFDTDVHLYQQWIADFWAYRAFIENQDIIDRYVQRYPFLAQVVSEHWSLSSLEWYLFPDTYFIDPELHFIDQLVYAQLEEFRKRIRVPYGDQIVAINDRLQTLWFTFSLSSYELLKLAAIIEKEERIPANRVRIASVFFNRLNDGMRIDADISLCYGLWMTHRQCTPSVIGAHVRDASNPYNTRAVAWLWPTPISSVTPSSIRAVLDAVRSEYYYYLHDASGQIHFARTLSEHNNNISKYLR